MVLRLPYASTLILAPHDNLPLTSLCHAGQLLSKLTVNSNKITSLLSLMSSSLANAQPLPPYLDIPEPFQFVKLIESVDKDILSIRHLVEPEYSAFAVLQIVSQRINNDLAKLVS